MGKSNVADKLFKVWLKDGSEEWLLIHIEIQGDPEETFPLRAFIYNIRSFLRYNKAVVTLAVLTDEQPAWRPDYFEYGKWGGRTRIDFLPVKLLDHKGQEAALERDPNPFAQVVLAHLQALALSEDAPARKHYKVRLVKGLYDRGWTAEDVRQLFRLIDWLMDLPPELQQDFREELAQWEEEQRMPYVTSIERLAREGRASGGNPGKHCQVPESQVWNAGQETCKQDAQDHRPRRTSCFVRGDPQGRYPGRCPAASAAILTGVVNRPTMIVPLVNRLHLPPDRLSG